MSGVYHLLDRGTIVKETSSNALIMLEFGFNCWHFYPDTPFCLEDLGVGGAAHRLDYCYYWIDFEVIFFSSIPEWLYMCFI